MNVISTEKKQEKHGGANAVHAFEPKREETYLLTCATNEDSNQPAHLRTQIRVFVTCMKKLCILVYQKCAR